MKIFKHEISFALILALFLAPLLCCRAQPAFANSSHAQEKSATCCPKGSSQNQDNHSQKTCDCNKINPFLQSQDSQTLKYITLVSFLLKHHLMADQSLSQLLKSNSQTIAFYSPPPSLKSSIPLYLQNPVLRI